MRTVAAALLLALSAGAAHATWHQPARKHHAPAKMSLYDRLGGKRALVAVVDDFVANVAADKRINRFFAKTDIPRLKRLLVEQLCAGTGGRCTYTGRDMRSAHRGMGVAGKDFRALVEDLDRSLVKLKVPAREKKGLIAILAPMRQDIVEHR